MPHRSFRSQIEIDAPPETVWRTLTDFEHYQEWNRVVPDVRVKQFKEGQKVRPTFVSARGKISFNARLSKLDPEKREFRWSAKFPIPGMFKAEHYFIIEPLGPDGNKSLFIKGEEYTGLMVPIFAPAVGAADKGLEEMNASLKLRAESIAAAVAAAAAAATAAPAAAQPEQGTADEEKKAGKAESAAPLTT